MAADYVVETTQEEETHRGRFSDKMLMSRDQGGFIRGVVLSYTDAGYDIRYEFSTRGGAAPPIS